MKKIFLEEYQRWIFITSFKIKSGAWKSLLNEILKLKKDFEIIQVFNADLIGGTEHIISAILRTYRAFFRKKNIAEDKSIELALRLSGRRQINEALKILGINDNVENIALICSSKDEKSSKIINELANGFSIEINDNLIDLNEEKKQKITKVYDLKTNDVLKELLMISSMIEIQE